MSLDKARLFFITGLSGAGKSQTLKFLEDFDFFCVDNLPPQLIDKFLNIIKNSSLKNKKIALGIDIRSCEFFSKFKETLIKLKEKKISFYLLFLDADEKTIIKRFSETRRKHPLTEGKTLEEKILIEQKLLNNFKIMANEVINTTNTNAKQLRNILINLLGLNGERQFNIKIISFGFKYGIPLSADIIFDVRFLPNPFYIPELGPLTGNDPEVFQYVLGHRIARKFIAQLYRLIIMLIPYYEKEGKGGIEIALGCTGGQHRSVAIANQLKSLLEEKDFKIILKHRELEGG